ncbi:hypothetical protein GE061_004006 [Apolygus lucorum]|uniref:Transposase Tc1-like domain-containing protein n=1 Tax=Apolygus lucorum TaxID=248454 RepID=A0A8S9WZF4_APOLU|nr:hypothetical protein GE061_004006 [Apolygus lucorum]
MFVDVSMSSASSTSSSTSERKIVDNLKVYDDISKCRDVKRQIIGLWKAKKTYREIAEALGVSKTCVEHSVNAFKETGTISEKPRSGRPRKTTERDDRAVVNLSKINRRASLPEIASEMEGFHGVSVSVSTVSRRLREVGMESRVALQKPLLNVGHRAKRRNFAREKRDWNIDMWRKVIFSDESRFELFPRRKIRVRRTKTEKFLPSCLVPKVQQGGDALMIWGCITSEGPGEMTVVDGL